VRALAGVALADLTTLRLGGPARRLVECATAEEVVEAVRAVDAAGEPLLVMGGGSNLVVADEGFPGTVVRIASRGLRTVEGAGRVVLTVAGGEPWDDLVAETCRRGWAGMEALSGIPGSTGATPVQNVGAYGQDVSQTVTSVTVYDRQDDAVHAVPAAACGFAYRHSVFKGEDRRVVLDVTFALRPGGRSGPIRYAELARLLGVEVGAQAPVADVRAAVLALRRGKGMVIDPADPESVSAGSFFTNPVLPLEQADRLPAGAPCWRQDERSVKTSAAWLIEQAGFGRGYGSGPVRVSTKHTLALTNRGQATTADLLGLAREIRDGVRAAFGVELVNEPVLVGCTL